MRATYPSRLPQYPILHTRTPLQATLKCENALQQNETMDVFQVHSLTGMTAVCQGMLLIVFLTLCDMQEEMDLAVDDDATFGQHAESEVRWWC